MSERQSPEPTFVSGLGEPSLGLPRDRPLQVIEKPLDAVGSRPGPDQKVDVLGHNDKGMNVEAMPLPCRFNGIKDPPAGPILTEQRPTVHT